MITPFYGEFLSNPIPLEMQLHPCNYNCAYCSAALNNRRGQHPDISVQALFNQISTFRQRETAQDKLLQMGYPVLISNRSDPFAPSNAKIILPLLETLTAQGVPVFFQTRGGKLVQDALSILTPSVWYISITGAPVSIEPGSPSHKERLDLLTTLRNAGHFPTVGIVPFEPSWIPDSRAFLQELLDRGATHIWTEPLHLNTHQRKNMTTAQVSSVGESLLATLVKGRKHEDPARVQSRNEFITTAQAMGINVFSVAAGTVSDYFDAYKPYYKHLAPTMTQLIHTAITTGRTPDHPLTFDEFWEMVGPSFPAGVFGSMTRFICAKSSEPFYTHKLPPRMSFYQLCAILWQHPEFAESMLRHPNLSFPGVYDETPPPGWIRFKDQHGFDVISIMPQATGQWNWDASGTQIIYRKDSNLT